MEQSFKAQRWPYEPSHTLLACTFVCQSAVARARACGLRRCMLHVNSNSRVLVNIHIRFSKYIHSASALRRDMIEYLEGETWCMGACSTLLHSINRKFNLFESV